MAGESFQNEIPASRVNIKYEKDTGGAKERVELPQRTVVVGDFTIREDETELEDVEKKSIDKDNFDSVMDSMDLRLSMNVPDKLSGEADAEISAELRFRSRKDFRPESVASQIPELNALLKIRELLSDLRARVINNKVFRKELQEILKNRELSESLMADIKKITGPVDQS
jgi:type VI secretion system protein ImpB